jgi:hypothetical protein|tara:strand:+ start:139 stop:468 length:330 start_codon:yes stop_codon:yes gene_type:complete
MFEEHRVITKFKQDVDEHVDIIKTEIKKENRKEVILWLSELLRMAGTWSDVLKNPKRVPTSGSFARGYKPGIDPEITRKIQELAQSRYNYVENQIVEVRKMLQAKGWKF